MRYLQTDLTRAKEEVIRRHRSSSPHASGGTTVDAKSLSDRLSQMNTWWQVVAQAAGGSTQKREPARAWIAERYAGVVRRYLTKAVGPEAAEELAQDFAVRVMEGRYAKADQGRGRFRDYLKTCIFAMVADYRAKQARTKMQPLPEKWEPADHGTGSDEEWTQCWRQVLIDRTLGILQQDDRRKGQHLYTVLSLRREQPELSSQQAATILSERIGKPVTDVWVRKRFLRARQRFAELLLQIVAESVNPATLERVLEELADLKLLDYVRTFDRGLPGRPVAVSPPD